jgi:hypothetical protein
VDEVIFLEVLEGDAVHARHRLDRFPVTVGRGYFNDVILDDPKVSAAHLRLERLEDGSVVLRDLGSQNGTFRVEPWAPLVELALSQDSRVQVGDTVLRFRGRTYEVPHTLVAEAPVAPQQRLFEQRPAFIGALAAAMTASALSTYLLSYERTDWGDMLISVLMPAALALFWAGGWSIASRIARRQFHYRAHATIGSLALMAAICLPSVLTVLGFSFSLGSAIDWLTLICFLGLMGWGLFWHLRYVTRWDSRRLGSMVGAVVLGFGLLINASVLLGNEDFTTVLSFPRSLMPASFRLVPASSTDEFFEEMTDLQEAVDKLAREE